MQLSNLPVPCFCNDNWFYRLLSIHRFVVVLMRRYVTYRVSVSVQVVQGRRTPRTATVLSFVTVFVRTRFIGAALLSKAMRAAFDWVSPRKLNRVSLSHSINTQDLFSNLCQVIFIPLNDITILCDL